LTKYSRSTSLNHKGDKTDQKLTQAIFKKAESLGADLVGACARAQMKKYPGAEEEIKKIDSKAKSILVYGVRMVSSSIACASENIRIPQFSTRLLYDELSRLGFSLMKKLDDLGFSASPLPTYLPVPMKQETKGMVAELSLRHIAYEAGLGTMGKNRLLITRQFGPRVRFGAILTDAPLSAGKPASENFCNECDLCVEACPTGALGKSGEEAIMLCARNHLKYGLPGLTRFAIKLVKAKTDEEKIDLVRSPEFWEYWQNLNTGVFYYCFSCLNACPIGK